jgi:hypothetical protein
MDRRPLVVMYLSVVALLLATLALAGCGSAATTTSSAVPAGPVTTGASTGPFAPAEGAVAPADMAGPYKEPAYLDPQPVDLAAVTNLEAAGLTDAEKQVLARQSFVAVDLPPEGTAWKFWQVYETARYQGLPALVTTDSILNAYHGLFDTILQRMEETALFDQAVAMSEALFAGASDQWTSATDPTVKEEARLNMAYFAVGLALLGGGDTSPSPSSAPTDAEVGAELAAIEAAAGPGESTILGYTEDYSQYVPRGHYTRSEQLEHYFKAMMWYGHTAFYINPRDPDITQEDAESLTRRAILISSALTGPAKKAWMAIYEPTSFLVGRADDLTVDDMQQVVTQIFGTADPAPDDLANADKIDSVRKKLNELPAPKIQSATVREPGDTENREENERSFRVMGQRFIPDSYAFQQLVWAYVGTEDKPRQLPMGLDVMTVLGSDQAYKIAKEDFGQDQYENWEGQIKKVNQEFAERSADLWPVNLYTGWLESLRHVMTFPAGGAPDFMKSRVWARKSLNAALGSWTELRHDTILYAKQSVTAEGEGGEEPRSPGYVEPYPAFYAKIAELATTLREGLVGYGLIDSDSANKLETMIYLTETLRSISEKELAGEALTAEEVTTIQEYGQYLEGLEQFSTSEPGRTLSPTAEKCPLVADVHSDYTSSPPQALEEATGYPLFLYAAFESDGQLQVFAGATYAYYEFTVPVDGRLTDEAWAALLDSGIAPPRPAWTGEWIVKR